MNTGRSFHTATLLPSGKVLVAGGVGGSGAPTSAELYDPASDSWTTTTGSLNTGRYFHTATLLPSGKVLVAGGNSGSGPLTSAELYDPASNTWTTASSLIAARNSQTATLLPSGKVLVAGGYDGSAAINSAELYDPATGTWSRAGNLTTARYQHTATLLPSGKVMVAGGYSNGGITLASAELYLYDLGIVGTRRPVVTTVNSPLTLGSAVTVTGTGFIGDSEASGGSTSSSATNLPLLQLRRVDNEQIVWTSPAPLSTRSATSYQSSPLSNLPPGPYLLTVYVNALASNSTMLMIGNKANQTISGFTPTTPVAFGATAQTLTATAGLSSSPLVFSRTSGPCTVSGAALSYTGAGNCVVAVNQAADANYNAAAPLSATIVVGKANQTISGFAPTTPVVFGAAAQTLTATAGASGSPLVFSLTSGPCTLNTTTLSYTGAGNCVVTVNQAADANYNAAAPVTQTIVVNKANQTISGFTPTTPVVFGATAQTLTATAGASSSPLVFSLTSGPCTLSTATLSYTGAGNCVVAVNQAADGNYNAAAPVTQSVTVMSATSTTTLAASPMATVFGQIITLTASTSSNNASRGGTVAFTDSGTALAGCAAVALNGSNGQASCSISSFSVGSHAVTATYLGDANTTGSANATPVSVTVSKAGTTVSLTPPAAINLGNAATILVNVAVQNPGAGSLTGTVLVSDGAVTCSFVLPVSNCSLTPTSAGSKTLTVTYTPDTAAAVNFTASSASVSLLVNPSAPGSTLGSSANPSVYGTSVTLTAIVTATAGGQRATGAVAFTDGGGSIAGCTAQPLTAGGSATSATATCVISAASPLTGGAHALSVSYAGDSNNTASSASLSQSITLAGQAIVFGPAPSLLYQGSAVVAATGGASGSAVIFSSTTPSVCTVSGATVTDITAGSCIVAANQAGNGNYSAAAQVTQSFVIARMNSQSTLSSSPTSPSPGQPLTLVYTVTPVASGAVSNAALNQLKSAIAPSAVPTGTVTFSDNGVVLATVALDPNGQASYTIAALSAGSHSFTAIYSGDSLVAPSSALMILAVPALIVPTLSGWMLLLLSLLLGAAALRVGAFRVRQQR